MSERMKESARTGRKREETPQAAPAVRRKGGPGNRDLLSRLGAPKTLPEDVREGMESALGADLGGVRLYESPLVAEGGAEAAASGERVAFAPGRLDLRSGAGLELLGHELSHVASQARGEVSGAGLVRSETLERRADAEGARAARSLRVQDPLTGGTLAPMTAAPLAGALGGPVQAKKKSEEEKKKEAGLAYMEEYRPLSQRTAYSKGAKSFIEGMDEEDRTAFTQKIDNMDYQFRALKEGGDQEKLYDFMRKATQFGPSSKGVNVRAFGGKYQKRGLMDTFAESMTNLMSDEAFDSPGYAEYLKNVKREGIAKFGDQVMDIHKSGDVGAQNALYADPEFHKLNSAQLAGTASAQLSSTVYGRGQLAAKTAPLSPEELAVENQVWFGYGGGWDSGEVNADLFEKGQDAFYQDYLDVTSAPEVMPDLSGGILNRRSDYETAGTPLAPKKRHRFRRRRGG